MKKLQLGTVGLMAQASPPAIVLATRPEQLALGVDVWVYFRCWRKGSIVRLLEHNPNLVRRGKPKGASVVVQLHDQRGVTVRRRCYEVLPAGAELPIGDTDRKAAQEFARQWWDAREKSLASSL